MTQPLWAQPIEVLAPRLRSGKLSPVALTQACLERIEQVDGKLQSFIHVSSTALEQAHKAEHEIKAGRWRGPLHGIPVGVKDNYLTRDMPTTAGTVAPGISFPLRDSAAAARLRNAGAVLIGKTRTHEFAWGNVTPPVRNPWDPTRVPSGSSGGSAAAVAAGLCTAALGSDTGGSIRMPASVTNIVGLKATFGRVSRDGVVPHSWSLDHSGPLARTVADAAYLLNVLAGYDPADPASQFQPIPDYTKALRKPVKGLRLGVCRNHFFERNQEDVERAVGRVAACGTDGSLPARRALAGRNRPLRNRTGLPQGGTVSNRPHGGVSQPVRKRGRRARAHHTDHRVEDRRVDCGRRRQAGERAGGFLALYLPL
jgi:aspartyl-tRNA(Asn)/glutamyl-tRNA(Gln) amidotransferase subunit A